MASCFRIEAGCALRHASSIPPRAAGTVLVGVVDRGERSLEWVIARPVGPFPPPLAEALDGVPFEAPPRTVAERVAIALAPELGYYIRVAESVATMEEGRRFAVRSRRSVPSWLEQA